MLVLLLLVLGRSKVEEVVDLVEVAEGGAMICLGMFGSKYEEWDGFACSMRA